MHLKITVKAFYKIHFIQVFKFLNAICSFYILSLSFFNDTKQFKNLNTALLSTATCKLKCTVINKVIFLFSSHSISTHCIFYGKKYSQHIKPLVNCIVLKQCTMLKHTLAKEEKKDCTVHYIPNSKKWYHFLWFDCPHVHV